jgi:hypothetical protein
VARSVRCVSPIDQPACSEETFASRGMGHLWGRDSDAAEKDLAVAGKNPVVANIAAMDPVDAGKNPPVARRDPDK